MVNSRAVLVALFISEKLQFGEVTTGASNDLKRATKTARELTMVYGMSDALGPRTFGETEDLIFLGKQLHEQKDYSEKTAEIIDKEISRLISEAAKTAKKIITEKKDKLKIIVDSLLEKETLEKEEFAKLLEN